MSLITQCPACSTLFKVVPDQLRVSQGWVRCGQCDEVFDANAHMRSASLETAAAVAPTPYPEPAHDPEPETVQAPLSTPQSVPLEHTLTGQAEGTSSYDWSGVLEDDVAPAIAQQMPAVDDFLAKSPQELIDPIAQPSSAMVPDAVAVHAFSASEAPDYLKSASFMVAKPPARKPSWAVRIALGIALVVLCLGLGAQWLVQERDRLAATHVALKPVLLALCEVAQCKVSPFKQIDAIVIDSSTFSKVQPDVYKLNVTLKNNAAVEIAKPALELTLTDSQDQAVFRRVIAPQELGDKLVTLAAGEEVHWTIPLALKAPDSAAKIAGYRVLAFYP